MLDIVIAPNAGLSEIAKPVQKIDKTIHNLIVGMKKALEGAKDPEGVGLAAPQVGRPLRLFIVKPSPKSDVSVYINPVISFPDEALISPKKRKKDAKKLEGCLSIPSIWGEVLRHPRITMSYLDEKGTLHKRIFKGLLAVILQHELDHINGILFPKRVLEQKGILYKSRKNNKGEDVFDEIEI